MSEIEISKMDVYVPYQSERVFRKHLANPSDREMMQEVCEHLAGGLSLKAYLDDNEHSFAEIEACYRGNAPVEEQVKIARATGRRLQALLAEDELFRRAVEGVSDGKKYSDKLLELLLKANDPERYTERKEVKHTGLMVTMNIENVDLDALQPEILVQEEPETSSPDEQDDQSAG